MADLNKRTFKKIQEHLFADNDKLPAEIQLSPTEIKIRERYQNVFSYWLSKPTLSDAQIIHYMRSELGMSHRNAQRDIFNVKILLGNVRNANKEWQRYKLIHIIDKAIAIAETNGNSKDMILAADKLGKYTQLDKPDAIHIPWDEIIPWEIEPTGDVSVLGIKPIPNLKEVQRKMRKKYNSTLIEEVEFEVVDNDKGNE